jgi:hypothetical protein
LFHAPTVIGDFSGKFYNRVETCVVADKLPFIQLYPGDWLRDEVSGCSLAAQGLWLRLMFIMHDSERYGYLMQHGSPIPGINAARRVSLDVEQYESLLRELLDAGVPGVMPDGTIYSRRMVRDAKRRLEAQVNGRKGGNPALIRPEKPPDKHPVQGVNPPDYPHMKMKMSMKVRGEGGGEGCDVRIRALSARLIDETGLAVHIPQPRMVEVDALVRIDGYDSARNAIDEALASGIGGIAAISYAAKVLAGQKAQKRLKETKNNGANGRNGGSPIAVRKDR